MTVKHISEYNFDTLLSRSEQDFLGVQKSDILDRKLLKEKWDALVELSTREAFPVQSVAMNIVDDFPGTMYPHDVKMVFPGEEYAIGSREYVNDKENAIALISVPQGGKRDVCNCWGLIHSHCTNGNNFNLRGLKSCVNCGDPNEDIRIGKRIMKLYCFAFVTNVKTPEEFQQAQELTMSSNQEYAQIVLSQWHLSKIVSGALPAWTVNSGSEFVREAYDSLAHHVGKSVIGKYDDFPSFYTLKKLDNIDSGSLDEKVDYYLNLFSAIASTVGNVNYVGNENSKKHYLTDVNVLKLHSIQELTRPEKLVLPQLDKDINGELSGIFNDYSWVVCDNVTTLEKAVQNLIERLYALSTYLINDYWVKCSDNKPVHPITGKALGVRIDGGLLAEKDVENYLNIINCIGSYLYRVLLRGDYVSIVDKCNKKKAKEEAFAARKDSLWDELISLGLDEPPF